MTFSDLQGIIGGVLVRQIDDSPVTTLLTDSRKLVSLNGAVFFAIKGEHHDGHAFIKVLSEKGVKQFIVESENVFLPMEANIIKVDSSVDALQALAAHQRRQFHYPAIGITGSNGKTIIKEWLFQLLSPDYKIVKNPGSYNSQIGVPLSVWEMQPHHELAIFEAGISRPHEMEKLEAIIRPTIGIFTNIGTAHDEGFIDLKQKMAEKLKLFRNVDLVIYCSDHRDIADAVRSSGLRGLSWGRNKNSDISVSDISDESITISYKEYTFRLHHNFRDPASIENCLHCVATMIQLGYASHVINERVQFLKSIPMRLELKDGINGSQLIDDTYNNDLAGLQISLDFLANQKQKNKKRLILSDILESGMSDESIAKKVASLLAANGIQNFVGVGKRIQRYKNEFPANAIFFASTDDFLQHFNPELINNEVVLIKGARVFQFERIVQKLQRKVHGTVMEIDLGAVVHNFNYFRSLLHPSTKIMVMVKAFAYGSGSTEIANLLQFHKVDYLGVAYADEGIELRKNNISVPIMVMNVTPESFEQLLAHKLEPEIYNFNILETFLDFLQGREAVIHIKIDTGMRRLGFDEEDISELSTILANNRNLKVASIFSHLAGADEEQHDDFSREQGKRFFNMAEVISNALGYKPLYHILNSPGILRLPDLQFDMVRLGIGLYGVDPTAYNFSILKPVATLKTIISQIKRIKAGDTIGYGRRGKADKEMTIATIAIGYADGFSRAFSRGVGEVMVQGKKAKVIGNVCMDMTMIDITGIDAKEGDEVVIFGESLPIQHVAEKIDTIPYEILTNTSERVKRVFVAESI